VALNPVVLFNPSGTFALPPPGRPTDTDLQASVSVCSSFSRQISPVCMRDKFLTQSSDIVDERSSPDGPLSWVSLGLAGIYLCHFASLYTQLPGLFSQNGLLPIAPRINDLAGTWLLQLLPSPELATEAFCAAGIALSMAQIASGTLRYGIAGMMAFAANWVFWHDLVIIGGRFTAYQMDFLLLDAAPLAVLAAAGAVPGAVQFGYRWLLARLYLGAGAVKLLSCDPTWRDLSAIHWHMQSQPLPNPIGAWAYHHLPTALGEATTAAVLIVEMAVPFLFLAPSRTLRVTAFALNNLLMGGITLFGNFGPLQALLMVIGLALLDEGDLPLAPGARFTSSGAEEVDTPTAAAIASSGSESVPRQLVSAASVVFALAAAVWTLHDISASCKGTWSAVPLVYSQICLAAASLLVTSNISDAIAGSLLLAGSVVPFADGLGADIPFARAFEFFNLGASPYGLFATMTGADGSRPTALIEAARSADGPWLTLPFRYQVMDPHMKLPFCFPHFPRLDWTLWFVPLGEKGRWVSRFINDILQGSPDVVNLLDAPAFHAVFPEGGPPPELVRLTPMKYILNPDTGGWECIIDPNGMSQTFSKSDFRYALNGAVWPSLGLLRALSEATGRGEGFIWLTFAVAEGARRAAPPPEAKPSLVALDVPELCKVLGRGKSSDKDN